MTVRNHAIELTGYSPQPGDQPSRIMILAECRSQRMNFQAGFVPAAVASTIETCDLDRMSLSDERLAQLSDTLWRPPCTGSIEVITLSNLNEGAETLSGLSSRVAGASASAHAMFPRSARDTSDAIAEPATRASLKGFLHRLEDFGRGDREDALLVMCNTHEKVAARALGLGDRDLVAVAARKPHARDAPSRKRSPRIACRHSPPDAWDHCRGR